MASNIGGVYELGWRKKKKKKGRKIIINENGDKMEETILRRLIRSAGEAGKAALKIAPEIYPEDELMLWLDSQGAHSLETAIRIPEEREADMYTLWIEDYVGHTYDERIYITIKGMLILDIIKEKFGLKEDGN